MDPSTGYMLRRNTASIGKMWFLSRFYTFQRESVPLAAQILDGRVLRGSTIKVEEAEFEMKGRYDPSKKPKMLSKKEKKKLQKEHQKYAAVMVT